jgi:hypothetical protein
MDKNPDSRVITKWLKVSPVYEPIAGRVLW